MSDIRTVFAGNNAVKEYLDPSNQPFTPLVEIPLPEEYKFDKVRVFAKLMNVNPLGNVKAIPAYNMLKEAADSGKLKGVTTLVESSSGNTVFSLAAIGRAFGVTKTRAIVSHEVLEGKLQLLRLFGTEVQINEEPICPDPEDKESSIYKAKQQGLQAGYFNPGQYDNPANPDAHENLTGKQVWEQTDGKITVFCAGLGTTGTMVGSARYLKRKNKEVKTVGVVRTPNNPVPGPRTKSLLKMIAFGWREQVDHLEEIGTKASFENSLYLIRSGISVGPSSGFALGGLLEFLQREKDNGTIDRLRNENGEVVCIFICCDTPLPYLKEYFEYLGEEHFPMIENENLLLYKKQHHGSQAAIQEDLITIPARDAYKAIFSEPKEKLWLKLKNGEDIKPKPNVRIIDIRADIEYEHFHIPGSANYDFSGDLDQALADSLGGNKVYVVCNFGQLSYALAKALRERGIEAFSISGGITEWSNLNLPRWRPEVCKNY